MAIILILHASLESAHVRTGNSIANGLKHLGVGEVCVDDGLNYANAVVA